MLVSFKRGCSQKATALMDDAAKGLNSFKQSIVDTCILGCKTSHITTRYGNQRLTLAITSVCELYHNLPESSTIAITSKMQDDETLHYSQLECSDMADYTRYVQKKRKRCRPP